MNVKIRKYLKHLKTSSLDDKLNQMRSEHVVSIHCTEDISQSPNVEGLLKKLIPLLPILQAMDAFHTWEKSCHGKDICVKDVNGLVLEAIVLESLSEK